MGCEALADTMERINALRRQRQDIFKGEDVTMEKRDALIASPERLLARYSAGKMIFTIRRAAS